MQVYRPPVENRGFLLFHHGYASHTSVYDDGKALRTVFECDSHSKSQFKASSKLLFLLVQYTEAGQLRASPWSHMMDKGLAEAKATNPRNTLGWTTSNIGWTTSTKSARLAFQTFVTVLHNSKMEKNTFGTTQTTTLLLLGVLCLRQHNRASSTCACSRFACNTD